VLTTQQVADLLPDVPQTTLYRHINLLLEGGVLTVVRESKVRGTLEREITLVQDAGRIDMATASELSPPEVESLFTAFVALLLEDFHRAQSRPIEGVPPAIYTQQRLYLSPDELMILNERMETLLAEYKEPARLGSDAEVQPWLFTGIAMTEVEPTRLSGIVENEEKIK
jgi:hypothetical protein